MGWLLDLLFEAVREMCSQFIVDMMDIASSMFTEILSCDLDLFEELFGVADSLYQGAIIPMAVMLLLMILVWQLFKSMFGKMGTSSEDPVELVFRSCFCLFMIFFAKDIANYILEIAGTPYDWVTGTEITVESFSEYVSVTEGIISSLGVDSLTISLLNLIMQFVVAWNYFKMLFILAERYALLGVFSYTSPLAFASGASKATNNVLASWTKMFGGQVLIVILDAWCVKMFLSAYGNMMASSYGFTKFFAATMCLIGFCKITVKLDSYMGTLGVNLGRITGGMSGLGAMLMAGRFLQFGGGRRVAADGGGSGKMDFGSGRSIPLGSSETGVPGTGAAGDVMQAAGFGGTGMEMPEDAAPAFTESGTMEASDKAGSFAMGTEEMESQNLPFGSPDSESAMPDSEAGAAAFEDMGTDERGMLPGMEDMDTGVASTFDDSDGFSGMLGEEKEIPPFGNLDAGGTETALSDFEENYGGSKSGNIGLEDADYAGDTMAGGAFDTSGVEGIGAERRAGDIEDSGVSMEDGTYSGSGIADMGSHQGTGSLAAGYEEIQSGGVSGNESAPSGGSNVDGLESSSTGTITGGSLSGEMVSMAGNSSGSDVGQIHEAGVSSNISGAGGSGNLSEIADMARTGATVMSGGITGETSGISGGNGAAENTGAYLAERDGERFMRYDASQYEKPAGEYQTVQDHGKTYYELPEQNQAPALLPETRSVLEKDGSIHMEKIYRDQPEKDADSIHRKKEQSSKRNTGKRTDTAGNKGRKKQ